MDACACVCVCAAALQLITIVTGAPDTQNTWIRPQPTLHSLMVSIDERLQTLDLTRWEMTLKQLEQRLDTLESTFRRLDTVFQDRLDKLERNLNSKELKDELTVEKLSHKVRDILDSSYDRYNRRLGYTEERLDMSFKKVQMSVEASLNRIEKQQEDVQTEVLEAVTILEDMKSHLFTSEDKLNSTHKAIHQQIQSLMSPSQQELQRISGSLEHLGSRLNSSLQPSVWSSQSDGPLVISDVITTIRNEINTEGTKFTNKVHNMYNDLWRRLVSVESMVKDLSKSSNTTQREVLEEVRSLVLSERRDFPGDSQENFIEVAIDALERKLQRKLLDLGRKLDDRMDALGASQNLVMDSCFDGGVCRGLDSRLTQVLERIVDVLLDKIEGFSNRTYDLDSLVVEMMELVKNQHSQLIRTVSHNTNMVVTLAKDSSDTNKLLHNSITQMAEKTDYNFQEIHDDLQEVAHPSGKICLDNDKNNDENTDQQKPSSEIPPKNIDEVIIGSTVSTTASTNHTAQPTKTVKGSHLDKGVFKITTDEVNTMADNITSPKPYRLEVNAVQGVDSSVIQIVSMISPNLTQSQLETLLRFLNSSVNLENVEAIVQNTQAEPVAEGGIVQRHDRSDVESELNTQETKQYKTVSFLENSTDENSYETSTEPDQAETTEISNTRNLTNFVKSENALKQPKILETQGNLTENIKLYVLLMKIKNGNLNISQLWEQYKPSFNDSATPITQIFVPELKKLCYGEQNLQDSTAEFLDSLMKNRLILINQKIQDEALYEQIENACNMLTDFLQSQDDQDISSED